MQATEYRDFAQQLTAADAAVPAGLRAAGHAVLAERFAVYRNNVHVSLVEALADHYPVVRALVGEDYFRAMARLYVQDHKPATPVLHEYGHDLPTFISAFEPARDLPWLADVARFERNWSEAWGAADAPALPLHALAGLSASQLLASRLIAHPAARLMRSPWPVITLWQAHQQPVPDLSAIDWRAENALITRPEAEITVQPLTESAAVFTAALLAGATIEAAALAAQPAPDLDIGATLAVLLNAGAITELIHR
jgi:hypothetical protein